MFENIRLITKRFNKVCDAGPLWYKRSRIHCCCELNFGMGEKVVWTEHNSIPLYKLIAFFDFAVESVTVPGNKEYQYSLVNNNVTILISWTRAEGSEYTFTFRHKQYKFEREVLRKTVSGGSVWAWRQQLYMAVMKILTQHVRTEICVRTGDLFCKQDHHPYEFKLGQKVKTISGPNVRTARTGFVIRRFYHLNDKTNMYQLLVNGKEVERRYLPGDLEKI